MAGIIIACSLTDADPLVLDWGEFLGPSFPIFNIDKKHFWKLHEEKAFESCKKKAVIPLKHMCICMLYLYNERVGFHSIGISMRERENLQEHVVFVFLDLFYMGDSVTPRNYQIKSPVPAVGPSLPIADWGTLRDLPK